MPLNLFHVAADWSKKPRKKHMTGFMPRDREIITDPAWEGKLRHAFRNVSTPINLIFLHDPKFRAYHQYAALKTASPLLDGFDQKLGIGALTVVFTHNYSYPNYAEMSPWIVIHRISHILFEIFQHDISTKYLTNGVVYPVVGAMMMINPMVGDGKKLHPDILSVLKFKSARTNTLTHFGEIHHEVMAQWIITGEVSFDTDLDLSGEIKQLTAGLQALLDAGRGRTLIL